MARVRNLLYRSPRAQYKFSMRPPAPITYDFHSHEYSVMLTMTCWCTLSTAFDK